MDVKFYHLNGSTPEATVPRLLEKIVAKNLKSVMHFPDMDSMKKWDTSLWTFGRRSFLPHGTADDPHPEAQPIYLTTDEETPNNASLLITITPHIPPHLDRFGHYLHMFDGRDETALLHARNLWKSLKDKHDVTYWKQEENGEWVNKTSN